MPVPVPVDREALRDIAETTGGKVFEAESAEEIVSVFEDLGEGVGTRTEPREITDGLALAALAGGGGGRGRLARLVRSHPIIARVSIWFALSRAVFAVIGAGALLVTFGGLTGGASLTDPVFLAGSSWV